MDIDEEKILKRPHRIGMFLSIVCTALSCTGCADPKAVQTFAAMAPDPKIAAGFVPAYAAAPQWVYDVQSARNFGAPLEPITDTSDGAKAIIELDTSIRGYMQALGALAGDRSTQTTTDISKLQTGLDALHKVAPATLSTTDVTATVAAAKTLTDVFTAIYRGRKLDEIITTYDPAFQTILDTQIKIVKLLVIPELGQYTKDESDAKGDFEREAEQIQKAGNSEQRFEFSWIQYSVNHGLNADVQNAAVQIDGATAYVNALGDIKKADATLYQNRNNVLTKSTFTQLEGFARDAVTTFENFEKVTAAGAK